MGTIGLSQIGHNAAITYFDPEVNFEITRTSDETYELWIVNGAGVPATTWLPREQLEALRDGITQALAAL